MYVRYGDYENLNIAGAIVVRSIPSERSGTLQRVTRIVGSVVHKYRYATEAFLRIVAWLCP